MPVGVEQAVSAFHCPAAAPSPSSRFNLSVEVKERLHLPALQRFSGLNSRLRFSYSMTPTSTIFTFASTSKLAFW